MKLEVRKDFPTPLPLTNDGHLSLFFVGVGSAFTKRQFQTNLLIIKGDTHLMIDCGTMAMRALHKLDRSALDIENFLITHSHADHIGSLEEVALMHRYVTRQKPTMIISEAYQTILWEMSMRGGCAYNEEDGGDLLKFTDFFDVIRPRPMPELPRYFAETDLGDLNIKIMRTKHIPDSSDNWENSFWSAAVLIDDSVFFTSDTRFDPELIELVEKNFPIHTIFHDCQFHKGGVHASLEELRSLPEDVRKKMFLVHYGDNWEEYEAQVAKGGFAGFGEQWQFYDFLKED